MLRQQRVAGAGVLGVSGCAGAASRSCVCCAGEPFWRRSAASFDCLTMRSQCHPSPWQQLTTAQLADKAKSHPRHEMPNSEIVQPAESDVFTIYLLRYDLLVSPIVIWSNATTSCAKTRRSINALVSSHVRPSLHKDFSSLRRFRASAFGNRSKELVVTQ